MSSYRGRGQGVNISQFLQNLNTYPSSEDQVVEPFNPDDLALFTNTQFFDFDMAQPSEDVPSIPQVFGEGAKAESNAVVLEEPDAMGFLADYGNFDYSQVLSGIDIEHTPHTQPAPVIPPPAAAPTSAPPAPIMPSIPQDVFSPSGSDVTSPTTTSYNPSTPYAQSSTTSSKRKSSIMDQESLEEASRFAAEEDKRRRNTAASARFRIKKKQREQALERTAKEMSEKVGALEQRISQLEMENKWLKNLITEKNGKSGAGLDIAEIYNSKFSAAANAPAASSTSTSSASTTQSLKAEVPAKAT